MVKSLSRYRIKNISPIFCLYVHNKKMWFLYPKIEIKIKNKTSNYFSLISSNKMKEFPWLIIGGIFQLSEHFFVSIDGRQKGVFMTKKYFNFLLWTLQIIKCKVKLKRLLLVKPTKKETMWDLCVRVCVGVSLRRSKKLLQRFPREA